MLLPPCSPLLPTSPTPPFSWTPTVSASLLSASCVYLRLTMVCMELLSTTGHLNHADLDRGLSKKVVPARGRPESVLHHRSRQTVCFSCEASHMTAVESDLNWTSSAYTQPTGSTRPHLRLDLLCACVRASVVPTSTSSSV
jgi:hypothetical protein